MKTKGIILLSIALALDVDAGSATWKLNAGGGNWNSASSWTPATVPNGPDDIATFDVSNTLIPSIFDNTEVDRIVFNSGASAFRVTATPGFTLTISGEGITNNSGKDQTFATAVEAFNGGDAGSIVITGAATAGTQTIFTNNAPNGDFSADYGKIDFFSTSTAGNGTFINLGGSGSVFGGTTTFHDSSTADDATFINYGGPALFAGPGQTEFVDTSTAGNASITNNGATAVALGGFVEFWDSSTAGAAVITNEGSTADGGDGGWLLFHESASAENATLIVNGGVGFTGGALISFANNATAGNATIIVNGDLDDEVPGKLFLSNSSTGGTARIELFGKGSLICYLRDTASVTVGSIEGDGFITLEDNEFIVGSNNLSTTFSGIIDDAGLGGSLTKVGLGSLVLRNANTYTGGTRVKRGSLIVNNTGGSGTGGDPVQVKSGNFGGTGIVAGAVTIGTGGSHAATLIPGDRGIGSFTVLNTLSFGPNGEYNWNFDSRTFQADGVSAEGVTIQSGATFSPHARGTIQLPLGTAFVVINNTATQPIAGTFANLADGSIVTVGTNKFQADYEGGDGNDLTLTVVP